MSRIAVTPYRGDDVEKFLPLLAPLAGAIGSAASAVGGALAGGAKAAVSAGKGLAGAAKAAGKGIKEAGKTHVRNKLGIGSEEEGGQSKTQTGMAALGSMQQASANAKAKKDEQTQGAMDAARRHAEISTNKGEPMDLAWLLLKGEVRNRENLEDWYNPEVAHNREKYNKKIYNSRMLNNTVGPFKDKILKERISKSQLQLRKV